MLTGCSVFQAEPVAENSRGNNVSALKVPAGLQQPAAPGQYDIPASDAAVTAVEIRSPALVLATASSSRVEEGEKLARVWFDRNDYTGELLPFLQQVLSKQFAEQGIELNQTDTEGLEYTTGWITRSNETGFWFWQSTETTEQARFKLKFEPRPHGRSVSLMLTMLEHQYFTSQGKLDGRDAQRQEIALLNQIIDRVGKEEIVVAMANKAKVPDVSLEPGFDAEGNPVLLSTQSIDVVWSQLELVFDALNLDVTDMNRSVYTYYLQYTQPEQGFWSSLWGNAPPIALPLSAGEYQLVLKRQESGTSLSLRDSAGTALSPQQVLDSYQPFVQAVQRARVEL
nr:outer membrane protein assembly factor BamC [Rheinheimera maricola]